MFLYLVLCVYIFIKVIVPSDSIVWINRPPSMLLNHNFIINDAVDDKQFGYQSSTQEQHLIGNNNNGNLDHVRQHSRLKIDPKDLQYHGTTTLAFLYNDSVIIAVDSMASIGDYVGSRTVRKVLPISNNIVATMAGGAADCSHWIRRVAAYVRLLEYELDAPVRVGMVGRLLSGMLREVRTQDISIGTMICGHDHIDGPLLYYVDSSGVLLPGNFFSVGSGSTFAYASLDSAWLDIKNKSNIDEAIDSAIWAVRHAAERDCFSGGFINVIVVNATGCFHVRRTDSRTLTVRIGD